MKVVIKNILKELHIFTGFSGDELERVEKLFELKTFVKDENISRKETELLIVTRGRIASTVNLPGSIELKRVEYGRGDFFGEMSLFGFKPRFDIYVARENSEALSISGKEILGLIENDSQVAAKFISQLISQTIRQLRRTSKFLADVVQWGDHASRRVITDELTGVYNRSFLEDAIVNFFEISKSNNKPLSLFMMDIDNFRDINSAFGFETGNTVLRESVTIIKDIISRHGIIARFGGDEFAILLPETNLAAAKDIAEQIRSAVEKHDFSAHIPENKYRITTSIGISSFPDTATELEAFKEKADASLYRAKEAGRNRVEHVE